VSAASQPAGRDPAAALSELAEQLRAEATVISEQVVEPSAEPALGLLAASGPRAETAPAEYALVVESVREGYLLHYSEPRLLAGHDDDLALLAGDHLYALGLERVAALGDAEAVAELSDLISLCAACHAEGAEELTPALWIAAAVAIGCGPGEGHAGAKAAARERRPEAAATLFESASSRASVTAITDQFRAAAEAIDLRIPRLADSG
jgi:hypothetical protein